MVHLDILPWLLLSVWAIPTLCWIGFVLVKPPWFGYLLGRRLRRLPTKGIRLNQPFPFLPGYQATMTLTGPHILGRKRRAGTRALVITIVADETKPAFPFRVYSYRHAPAHGGRPYNAPDQLDTRAPVTGDQVTFYAMLNAERRIFLDRHEFSVEERQLCLVLADSAFDSYRTITQLAELDCRLEHLRAMVRQLSGANRTHDFTKRFAADEPAALRQRALDAWWQTSPQPSHAAIPVPPKRATTTPEMIWFRLDRGEHIDGLAQVKLSSTVNTDLSDPAQDPFAQNLRNLLQRLSPKKRRDVMRTVIYLPERQSAVAKVLVDFPEACDNAMIMAAYKRGANNANLLRAIVDEGCDKTIRFLIGILRTGRFQAQVEAARRLGEVGNGEAMVVLEQIAPTMSPQNATVFKEAALRLRERFAGYHEPGALSPVKPEGNTGALSQADTRTQALTPVQSPPTPAGCSARD